MLNDAPIDIAKERGGPPVATSLDKEIGRTITIDPRGGWKEVYCKTDLNGMCACSPQQEQKLPLIVIDDPLYREKIIEAGLKSRQADIP